VTVYFDSSAIVSVYLRERGRQRVIQRLVESEPAACSELGYAEVRSTLVRVAFKENPRRISSAGFALAESTFEEDWPNYFRIPVTSELIREAGQLARVHILRAYDAVHLATALALRNVVPDNVMVSTWDSELDTAAVAAGLSLAHEVST
jgi:predicted nucleic acid-binding protein